MKPEKQLREFKKWYENEYLPSIGITEFSYYHICTAYANHVLTNHEGFQSNAELKRKLSEYKKMDEMSVDLIADYERKLAALQRESVLANSKISLLESQITDLQKEVDGNEYDLPSDIKLQRIRKTVRFTIQKYSELVTDLQQQLTESKTELGIAHIEVDRLKRLLESCEAALEDCDEQLDNSHLAEQSLQQKLTEAQKRYKELESQIIQNTVSIESDIIPFAAHLTGHDEVIIKQMYKDWK